MLIKREIPNLITLSNLSCGLAAIYMSFEGQMLWGCLLIFLGAFFDFFDGLAARKLNVAGPLGKELDSMADLVTFGVAPGFLVFHLFDTESVLRFSAFFIPLFSAYRLAKFNIDERQSKVFIGLPTPGHAIIYLGICFASLGYTGFGNPATGFILATPLAMALVTLICSALTVSEISFLAFKFGKDQKTANRMRIGFVALAVISLLIFSLSGLTIIVLLYLLFGLLNQIIWKHDLQS